MEEKTRERLASLEAKVEILLDLLKEIKEDLKEHPSKEEYLTLVDRQTKVESKLDSLQDEIDTIKNSNYKTRIRVGVVWGIIGFAAEVLVRFWLNKG